ncbi:hypothetical protein DsansV1_C05g0051611 [Dioscorea sansibarensis]
MAIYAFVSIFVQISPPGLPSSGIWLCGLEQALEWELRLCIWCCFRPILISGVIWLNADINGLCFLLFSSLWKILILCCIETEIWSFGECSKLDFFFF